MIEIPVHAVMLDSLGLPEGQEQDVDLLERVADFVVVEKLAAALVATRTATRPGNSAFESASRPTYQWWRHTASGSGLRSSYRRLSAVLGIPAVGIDLRDLDSLVDRQLLKLSEAAVNHRDGTFLWIQTSMGTVTVEFRRDRHTEGSYRARRIVCVTASGAQRFLLELVAAALVAVVLPDDVSELFWGSDTVHYVCTVETYRAGDEAELVEKAAQDLLIADGMSASARREAIEARQFCLRAAGFDPGPIDGVFGPQSERAAEAYAYFYHGIRTNWDSKVFLEQLVENAMKRMPHAANHV